MERNWDLLELARQSLSLPRKLGNFRRRMIAFGVFFWLPVVKRPSHILAEWDRTFFISGRICINDMSGELDPVLYVRGTACGPAGRNCLSGGRLRIFAHSAVKLSLALMALLAADISVAAPLCDVNAVDVNLAGTNCARNWFDANLRINEIQTVGTAESYKLRPSDNRGRLHLKWGEALLYAGKPAEAKAQFARALSLDLSPSEKSEVATFRY